MDLGEVARQRIREPLLKERIVASDTIYITQSGIREPWTILITRGKAPPYGYLDAGRVLIVLHEQPDSEPLAGLLWTKERGRKFIHQAWVDRDFQHLGVGRMLVAAYVKHVSPAIVMQGPFSAAGRAFARSVGAKMVNDDG